MIELLKAFLENAKERIKNPLIGTFITSWIVFNWKSVLILLFSSDKIENKIFTITTTYCNYWLWIYWPLMVTITYIFGLPYINLGIDWLLSNSRNKRLKRENRKLIIILDAEKDVEEARIRLERAKTEYKDRESLTEMLNNSVKEIDELKIELSVNKKQYEINISSYEAEHIKISSLVDNLNTQINVWIETYQNLLDVISKNPDFPNLDKDIKAPIEVYFNSTKNIFMGINESLVNRDLAVLNSNEFAKKINNAEKKYSNYEKTLRKITGIDNPFANL